MDYKPLLAAIFSVRLLRGGATLKAVSRKTGLGEEQTRSLLEGARSQGLVKKAGSGFVLTKKGRARIRVVFIGGGFEVIHFGHLHTIQEAKSKGDVLVVVVARDSTIRRRKGREPVTGENDRARLLSSLREVDAAILGVEGNIYETLERVAPDVVALGYDQHHMEADVASEGAKRGLKVKVVRLGAPNPEVKTSRILAEL